MLKKLFLIGFLISIIIGQTYGQNHGIVKTGFLKNNIEIFPGEIVNLPVSIENTSERNIEIDIALKVPQYWKAVIDKRSEILEPGEKKLLIFSVQSSASAFVGEFEIVAELTQGQTDSKIGSLSTVVEIKEYENISMVLVESHKHVNAGETIKSVFLIQNNGNTNKKVYLETLNCEVNGEKEVEVQPGKSLEIEVLSQTSEEIKDTYNGYLSVRAVVGEKVYENIYHTYLVFPKEKYKKDLFFRYPVSASATYFYSNTYGEPTSGFQFEAFGSGYLDTGNKHFMEFLVRAPDNQDLGFMGLYDQYYINYHNKNLNVTVGEQSYQFTELTEMSRFGFGAETSIKTNKGLKFGAIYVRPRFYDDIQDELATYTGLQFNKDNWVDLFYIAKNTTYSSDLIHLFSLSGNVIPLKNTSLGFEISGGQLDVEWDKAFRFKLNTQFSIFQLAGIYSYAGENYPGYYSNSKFYSANVSARLSKKLSVGFYAKEDFQNAQLDTFFVSAPYSKSYQAVLNYNLARKANFKIFWRDYERKDRLSKDKFHYKTQSLNSQFAHRFKSLDYSILGEYGETTNFQLGETENQQRTYRVYGNLGYTFGGRHTLQIFGSWSNVNSFITDEQRNLTYGISATSYLSKNIQAMLFLQNAYNIEDYYQNRNLLQASVDYTFLKNHKISLRGFYTLFKQETEDPDLTASISYSYNLGIPLKQVIQAGDLNGTISYYDGRPAEGMILNLLNKKAITNSKGEFSFTDVQPGKHLLSVNNEKFEIDEIGSIPLPAQVEIIGDEQAILNFKITKGARFNGQFKVVGESGETSELGNIVVELKSVFDQFRIASKEDGTFSFPLVRPGEYTFKIYGNTLPEGHSVKQSEYKFELRPKESKNMAFELTKKKRNIKFSSKNFVLTPSRTDETRIMQNDQIKRPSPETVESLFYSIQIGAFRREKSKESRFFINRPYDFQKHSNGFFKYYIGWFGSFNEAQRYLSQIKPYYKKYFIVAFKNGESTKPKQTISKDKEEFYSVQVGAFRLKKTNDSKYFSAYPFDFEQYQNNLNKYFIGKFANKEDAKELQIKLSEFYRNPFVVIFKNGRIVPAN